MFDLPQAIVIGTVWTYWACVLLLVLRSHLQFQTKAGAVPRTRRERLMWLIWVPVIVLWQIFPYVASTATHPMLVVPESMTAGGGLVYAIRCAAAASAVLAYVLTIPCWLRMGKDWSMAVVPSKEGRLITEGLFSRVRHPIYGLSILLMVATVVAVPTPAMLLTGLVHITMICLKAMNEETYMHEVHGEAYAAYCRRTNRFLPRLKSAAAADYKSPEQRDAA